MLQKEQHAEVKNDSGFRWKRGHQISTSEDIDLALLKLKQSCGLTPLPIRKKDAQLGRRWLCWDILVQISSVTYG